MQSPTAATRAALAAPGLTLFLLACGAGNASPAELAFDGARAWRDLERIVAVGPREAGSEGLEELRGLLTRELEAAGLRVQREAFTASTPAGEIEFVNLYADLLAEPLEGRAAPMIVICTHIDTKRLGPEFVGANDGGSGTAVLLELARALAAAGKPKVSYRFLFLDGEEAVEERWVDPDNTYGSRHHVKQLKAREGFDPGRYKCVLLDMVGDRDLKLIDEDYSTDWMLQAFFRAARENDLGQHVGGRRQPIKDDHLRFLWDANIESVDLIDFEYGPGNAWWHTTDDTLDKCSEESLQAIGTIVLKGLPAVEARLIGLR